MILFKTVRFFWNKAKEAASFAAQEGAKAASGAKRAAEAGSEKAKEWWYGSSGTDERKGF